MGFTVVAHGIWGRYVDYFEDCASSLMSMMLITQGELHWGAMLEVDKAFATIMFTSVFVVVNWLFYSIFSALLIDAYYAVAITHGYIKNMHGWERGDVHDWVMPALLVNIYSV